MTKVKIAVSLPEEHVDAARRAVAEGRAPSVSAYVAEALASFGEHNGLIRYLDELDAKHGAPGPDAEAWATRAFDAAEELDRQGGYQP